MSLRFANVRLFLVGAFCALLLASSSAQAQVVISQVYGGGGNAGASYKNDFIEVFNRGASSQSLAGWSVQYASAAGSSWAVTNLTSVSLAPGQYYLIQESAGTGGTTSLPTPEASGGIAMSATAGKVALVSNTTALTCGATNNCLPNAAIMDLVGYGTASSFEGPGAAPTLANATAALRASSGCTDSNNNASDFTAGAPNPRNAASGLHPCLAVTPTLAISNVSAFEGDSGTTNFTFTVSLTGGTAPAGGVTFDIATANATATTANNDYVAKTLTLQSVTSTYTFTVQVNGDVDVEPNETFSVNVTNIVGATNTSAQATGTIVNDDSPTPPTGTGSANPSALAVGDTTTLTVNVTPGVKPASTGITVTADLTSIGGSAQAMAGSGNAFTLDAVVASGTTLGAKTIPVTISDAQMRSSTSSIGVTIVQPPPPADHVVISQVYGGGGNSGALYTNDFVELYNPTHIPFDLTGWTLQYASASGTAWNNFQTLGGIIGPGQYYLVSLASGGATGDPLPAANVYGSINMSGTAGKIALSRNGLVLSGNCPIPSPDVIDFVGYGSTATCSEGNLSAPAPSNTTAIFRKDNGNTDTNINRNDFVAAAPGPRRTATVAEIGPSVVNTDPAANSTTSPHDGSITVNFSEAVDVTGAWYNISCGAILHNEGTVAHTSDFKSYVITPNANFQFGEPCSVTIFKDGVHDQDTDDSAPNTDTLLADFKWDFTVVGAGQPAPYPSSVHLTMGNPTSATADENNHNNYLMEKPTYSLSYNRDAGRPNWVSWHLDSSWYGSLARVDTFRPDPAVPPTWYRVAAFDFSFTGFDRGHMTPNADRDNENRIPINQETYLMSQMVAQAPDNNQGPWAALENDLRTIVAGGTTELYIVSGPAGSGGTGSNGPATTVADGHVLVPAYTWKAALVLDKGDNDVTRVTAATRTIAVIMPNIQGIRNDDWHTYLKSVDQVEALCSCDLFSNVPAAIQNSIEAGVNGTNPPGVADESLTTREDTAGDVTLEAVSASASPTFSYSIVTGPSHGSLSGTGATRTYTPAPDFNGTDSFTFRVNDGSANSNTATVTITVVQVNDAPNAAGDDRSTDEDTALVFAASDLTANDNAGPADESTQTLTVSAVSMTASTHGMVALGAGQVTYTPEPNFNGPASFTYTVCDNGFTAGRSDSQCSTATVNVMVKPVNDPPVLDSVPPSATTPEEAIYTFTAHATDVDGDGLTFSLVGAPAGATIDPGTGVFAWTPTEAQGGTGSPYVFKVRVSDGIANIDADISLSVSEVNQAPVIDAIENKTVSLGSTITFTASATDVDVPVQTLTYSLGGAVPAGAAINGATGEFTWTPSGTQAGLTFSFDVLASDGVIATATPVVINVIDATPPSISALLLSLTQLWPANHQMVDINVAYSASDLGDPSPACTLSVFSNEPVDGTGDGDTAPDWQIVDAYHIRLRAERAAAGTGRIYTVIATCSDRFGNTARSSSATVLVPKSKGK